MSIGDDYDGWDAWAACVVTHERLRHLDLSSDEHELAGQRLAALERSTLRLAQKRDEYQRTKESVRRWDRFLSWFRVGAAVCVGVMLLVTVISCAPTPAETVVPSIDGWSTVTARSGLTPSHVGACVPDIDTATAAELVKARNNEIYVYGPLPQAGLPYDVPTSTINCKGITG